jgi:hypothetical protein
MLMELEFSRQIFGKILRYQILSKSVKLDSSCYMRRDGQIDMTKLIVAFGKFTNAPKNKSKLRNEM